MSLHVYEQGLSTALTIVFLHGGGSAWMWQPQWEALTDYHILVPDLPEHGQSAEIKPFSFHDSAARR